MSADLRVLGRGDPRVLGVTPTEGGTCVAVWASHAEAVEVCATRDDGTEERAVLPARDGPVHSGRVAGLGPGDRYGFRVHGAWDPSLGLRHDPAKLLCDPWAWAVDGAWTLHDAVLAGSYGVDSSPYVPRSVVVDVRGLAADEPRPRHSPERTVVVEAHVAGATRRLPGVPEALRGTYAGLGHPAALERLVDLGATAVELLPVAHHVSEPHLLRRGLRNVWGYNTLAWRAPHAGYSASGSRGEQVVELREMVRALHGAGLEVWLDVVLNHSAEGDEVSGPTLSLRGLDNVGYYRLRPDDLSRSFDVTGCGNSLDLSRPPGMRLALDSLRAWVEVFGVDGFRFDLAPAMARGAPPEAAVDTSRHLVAAMRSDPVLSGVRLVAEPWDLGPDGYSLGRFPHPFAEWSDRYRETARAAWLRAPAGEPVAPADLGRRLTGSADVLAPTGRPPWASVNLVTSHDGSTLADLTTWQHKRNEANGEDNRDGDDASGAWDCGHPGPGGDPGVQERRRRLRRALVVTLLVSAGTPLLLLGDERGRSQGGNTNAYCQDALLDVPWEDGDDDLAALVAHVARLRARAPALRRARHPTGQQSPGRPVPDVAWFREDGQPMSSEDWHDPWRRVLVLARDGASPGCLAPDDDPAAPGATDAWLVLLGTGTTDTRVALPPAPWPRRWTRVLDSSAPDVDAATAQVVVDAPGPLVLPAHAVVLLRAPAPPASASPS